MLGIFTGTSTEIVWAIQSAQLQVDSGRNDILPAEFMTLSSLKLMRVKRSHSLTIKAEPCGCRLHSCMEILKLSWGPGVQSCIAPLKLGYRATFFANIYNI